MFNFLSAHPMCLLVFQSDLMTKIVLFVLLLFSIASWTVFIFKIVIWRLRKKQMKTVLTQLKNAHNIEDVFYIASKYSHTLPGYILNKELSFVKTLLLSDKAPKHELDDREWEMLIERINQLLDSIIIKEESMLSVLSMSASVGPLLGLFGTVWGLVHSFVDISQKQSADIAVVAPGIAEALITTVAGLLVAIPAALLFGYLGLKLKELDVNISNISGRFLWIMNKNLVKKNQEN